MTNLDRRIAANALHLAAEIERDMQTSGRNVETFALKMVERAHVYRDLLKPFDDRLDQARVPTAVFLSAAS